MAGARADHHGGSRRWARRPGVLSRAGGFGVALWAPEADAPVVLAGTGPAVWEELAEGGTLDELAARLARRYGTEPDTVSADLAATLDALAAAGVAGAGGDSPVR